MPNSLAQEYDLGGVIISPREFELFRALIYQQTGISLGDSKATMLSTRLGRRMRQLRLPSFDSYYQFLKQQSPECEEYQQFINSVTTNKTFFFREIHHFDFLAAQLRTAGRNGEPLRIWSSACSTGEEPYSIGITVVDALGSSLVRDVRILASDIDTAVLQSAQSALYPAASLVDVPPAFRHRFFSQVARAEGPGVMVNKDVRDLITFRCRNLVSPSWEINIKFDFIFCRNVLIYFDHQTQDRILRRFLQFLKPDGFLIVGHSEHLNWLSGVIEPVGQTIYRIKKGARVA